MYPNRGGGERGQLHRLSIPVNVHLRKACFCFRNFVTLFSLLIRSSSLKPIPLHSRSGLAVSLMGVSTVVAKC